MTRIGIVSLTALALIAGCSQLAEMERLAPTGLTNAAGVEVPSLGAPDGLEDIDVGRAVDAASDLGKAVTLSDGEVKGIAKQFIAYSDKQYRVAGAGSKYGARLARLTEKHRKEDGLGLNFKVYLSPEINAFATADGSIRFHSGLMDLMSDDELRSVIGHEIGHVKLQHIDRATRLAYAASAVRKGVASTNSIAGLIAESEIGGAFEKFLDAQFSQSQELDSDRYGMQFLLRHGYKPQAAITAMKKLGALSGDSSLAEELLSSHPVSQSRIEELEIELARAKRDGSVPQVAANDSAKASPSKETDIQADFAEIDAKAAQQDDAALKTVSLKAPVTNAAPAISAPDRASGSGWYVQLSAETDQALAQDKIQLLQSQGYETRLHTATVREILYHRVLVGPFAGQDTAREKLPVLRQTGLADGEPFIRKID